MIKKKFMIILDNNSGFSWTSPKQILERKMMEIPADDF